MGRIVISRFERVKSTRKEKRVVRQVIVKVVIDELSQLRGHARIAWGHGWSLEACFCLAKALVGKSKPPK